MPCPVLRLRRENCGLFQENKRRQGRREDTSSLTFFGIHVGEWIMFDILDASRLTTLFSFVNLLLFTAVSRSSARLAVLHLLLLLLSAWLTPHSPPLSYVSSLSQKLSSQFHGGVEGVSVTRLTTRQPRFFFFTVRQPGKAYIYPDTTQAVITTVACITALSLRRRCIRFALSDMPMLE